MSSDVLCSSPTTVKNLTCNLCYFIILPLSNQRRQRVCNAPSEPGLQPPPALERERSIRNKATPPIPPAQTGTCREEIKTARHTSDYILTSRMLLPFPFPRRTRGRIISGSLLCSESFFSNQLFFRFLFGFGFFCLKGEIAAEKARSRFPPLRLSLHGGNTRGQEELTKARPAAWFVCSK